jgi:hypothetical protein
VEIVPAIPLVGVEPAASVTNAVPLFMAMLMMPPVRLPPALFELDPSDVILPESPWIAVTDTLPPLPMVMFPELSAPVSTPVNPDPLTISLVVLPTP